jgi:hypothetical protein
MLMTQKQSFDSIGKIKAEISRLIEVIKNKSLNGSGGGGTSVIAVNPL